ncbi:Uncharacterised protein [Segatella copri]|nr:Uncharacterised protein [Segatella copri]
MTVILWISLVFMVDIMSRPESESSELMLPLIIGTPSIT